MNQAALDFVDRLMPLMAVGPIVLRRRATSASVLARYWPRLALPAIGLLCCLAATLAVRRLAGALVQPLSPMTLIVCALLVLAAAVGLRRLVSSDCTSRTAAELLNALTTLSLALLAWSLSLLGSSVPALCLLWMAAIVPSIVGQIPWRRLSGKVPRRMWLAPTVTPASPLADEVSALPAGAMNEGLVDNAEQADDREGDAGSEDVNLFNPQVVQQMTRLRGDDGQESITGWCRVAFVPGQRLAYSHLAFCPPLHPAPAIALEQLDGPQARMKAGQTLPHGARIELKLLDALAESSEVLYRFHAR